MLAEPQSVLAAVMLRHVLAAMDERLLIKYAQRIRAMRNQVRRKRQRSRLHKTCPKTTALKVVVVARRGEERRVQVTGQRIVINAPTVKC